MRVFRAIGVVTLALSAAVVIPSSAYADTTTATVTLDPSPSIGFGGVRLGESSAEKTVTMTVHGDAGDAPVIVGMAVLGGADPGAFTVTANTCAKHELSPGDTCAVSVVARPTVADVQAAMLTFETNSASGNPAVQVWVTGTPNDAGAYFPVTPTRIMDTRTGVGAPKQAVGAGGVVHLQVGGKAGVPATGASAVVLNVTVTAPTAGGYLTVYPTGVSRPAASSLNFPANWTGANSVTVALGTGGQVDIYNYWGNTQVIVDVSGFYAANDLATQGGGYHAVTPFRALDTRIDPDGPLPAGLPVGLAVDLGATVNTHVRALAVNVTAVNGDSSGYLTTWSGDGARPTVSTLNYAAHTIVPNLAVVPTMPCFFTVACENMPMIALYNGAPKAVHVLVDVFGYFDDGTLNGGLRFHPITPTRIVDSRIGQGAQTLGTNTTATVTVPSSVALPGTAALALNVTAVRPTAGTYFTVWPTGMARPAVSNLNPAKGQTIPNAVLTGIDSSSRFNVYNLNGTADVVIDVAGTYTPGPSLPEPKSITAIAPRSLHSAY